MAELVIPADLPRLAPRAPDSHKGHFGSALLVGGSRGMAGAIALSGMAALRSGAGKVRLAIPDCCLETVAQFEPCYMTMALEADDRGCICSSALEELHLIATTATCVAIGPGLGLGEELDRLVGWLYRTLPKPLVIDADGLNALVHAAALNHSGGPRILTPHPGEFLRLARAHGLGHDKSPDALRKDAISIAQRNDLVIVLKGQQSFITDGQSHFHNTTGNPGLATGGTGDVLTGVITALVCQGLSSLDAARLGAFAHGLAGDLAADKYGHVGMTARDVIEFLPAAWQRIEE